MRTLKTLPIAIASLSISLFFSCQKDNNVTPTPEVDITNEFNKIRVLINDKETNELNFVSPFDGSTKKFEGDFPDSYLYTSDSKRYAISVNGGKNSVKIFDSGIEYHNDHTHVMPFSGWSPITGTFTKPTHIFTKFDEIVIFNDGTGNFSYAEEKNIENAGSTFKSVTVKGTSAHHGGITKFKNGNYAITNITTIAPGTQKAYVNIVDKNGEIVHEGTIETTGIHGDDSDGEIAIFGSKNGALVVKNNGEQFLIPNPSELTSNEQLGTIYYAAPSKKFYGYAKKGLYEIDVNTKKINQVLKPDGIYQLTLDHASENFIVLNTDGNVKIISCQTNKVVKDEKFTEALKENVAYGIKATKNFVYFISQDRNELEVRSIKDFKVVNKIKISEKPNKLAIIGFETND